MKTKLSATVDEPLVKFLDSLPGRTRSEKLERALLLVRRWDEERRLRSALGEVREEPSEREEREWWGTVMEEAMWRE